jgi:nucleotide-binding universal stress UspA family protein
MERIVVGVDGSEPSKNALRFALEEGEQHHLPVLAVHAWSPPFPPPDPVAIAPLDYADLFTHVQEGAERLLANLVEEAGQGRQDNLRVEQLAIEGSPASVLIETASDDDLLVVGSRGRGGFSRLLLGSVSEQVARHAPCPVLIHRTSSRR